MRPIYSLFLLLFFTPVVFAGEPTPSTSLPNQIVKNVAQLGGIDLGTTAHESQIYSQWGLSNSEWQQYKVIRQGPIGVLNPNIDPLLALAMGAKSAIKMHDYVERYIHIRHQLTKQLLDISKFYKAKFTELYPEPVIDTRLLGLPDDSVWPTDSFVLVTSNACQECMRKAQSALRMTKTYPNNQVDIYIQDLHSNAELAAWSSQVIDKEDLLSNRVTINPGTPYLNDTINETIKINLMVRRGDQLIMIPNANELMM